uniref:Uncharacterized protein n=1 Tax=Lactuca sativa TaxID=4236 RepID=A0A9R1VMS8_LACSA|nr:hypothetical protein LSAT_V11C500243490 [Lactuca sativa]
MNRDKKKKKKIGEDDADNEEDVYEKDPEKPFPKTRSSDKELAKKLKKQQAELEQKQKEQQFCGGSRRVGAKTRRVWSRMFIRVHVRTRRVHSWTRRVHAV